MLNITSYLLLLLAPALIAAQKVGVASDKAFACWSASSEYNFGCNATDIKCLCQNTPFLETFSHCFRHRASDQKDINDGYVYFYRQCYYNANISYTLGDMEDMNANCNNMLHSQKYNQTKIAGILAAAMIPTIQQKELESIKFASMQAAELLSSGTALPKSPATATASTQTSSSASTNPTAPAHTSIILKVPVSIKDTEFEPQYKGAATVKYEYRIGSLYGSLLMGYWGLVVLFASIYRFIQQVYPEVLLANNRTANYIRKYLVLPATFRRHRSRPVKIFMDWYMCAPTRGQSILITMYIIFTIIALSINYNIYDENPVLPGASNQALKYLGVRTGIIAFTQLPLVIIFGSRNNPLIWSTGWPYDTFQVYHRWCARIMMLNVVIHSACFIAISVIGKTWVYRWEEIINWRFGNMATYAGIIMTVLAINRFRAKFYEAFFLAHKIFFIIFMIGIFRHCWDFGWMPWVYASLALYLSERFTRLFKLIVSGFKNEAFAEVYSDGTFRLSVRYSRRWNVKPGQYCYVRVLTKNLFWQAHPFTVYKSPGEDANTLQFCIQAQKGATRKIADYLAAQPEQCATLPVMIEGPYGVIQKIENYNSMFLIAGGLGITAVYSHALDLLQHGKKSHKVYVMWIIPNAVPLEWFSEELLSLMHDSRFDIQIYITKAFSSNRSFSGDDSDEEMEEDFGSYNCEAIKSVDTTLDPRATPTSNSRVQGIPAPLPTVGFSRKSSSTTLHDKRSPLTDKHTFYKANFYESNVSVSTLGDSKNASSTALNKLKPTSSLSSQVVPAQRIRDQFAFCLFDKRPNINEEIAKALMGTGTNGTMAIVSCGPPRLVDNIRASIVEHLMESEGRVEYFEEAFSW